MTSVPSCVTRLAPSPTGAQHIGNARTYLIAWLAARSRGGRVVLRIEDIDSPRIKAGAAEQACEDLRWLGLDWDEGPYVQTQRLPRYELALAQLQQQELVYPCICSRTDIERAASAPHAEHEGPIYPGTCAGRRVADATNLGARPFAWRFRDSSQQEKGSGTVAGTARRVLRTTVPDPFSCWSFADRYCGNVTLDWRALGGDFVVWKSAGTPAYQLAVVVDDAANGVTEVIRGDDLLPSTPRQLQLYAALGLPPPAFAHLPLVVGPDGRRLAKRHGDTRLVALRQAGVRAEALLGLLAWSCGWLEDLLPVAAQELVPLYRLDTIPRRPFVLLPELLERIA
jgi:glutamyl-tRNA synthetase